MKITKAIIITDTNRQKIQLIQFLFLFVFLSPTLWAQDTSHIPKIIVGKDHDASKSSLKKYSIQKVEKVKTQKLKAAESQTLNDLVKGQAGLDSQLYCANCGAKRLTINGLKGEHTSILVDGLPLHSAISSIYGVDNIPTNGLQEVEVMRGTGASLTNPEAIGGSINLITVDPLEKEMSFISSVSTHRSHNHSLLLSQPSESTKHGLSIGGQWSSQEHWDVDNNNVAESPQRQNYSIFIKGRSKWNSKNDLSLRLSHSELEILGGTTRGFKPIHLRTNEAGPGDFLNGDIRNRFTGDDSKITDSIKSKRQEAVAHWSYYANDSLIVNLKSGFARNQQQAIYMHSFDYANVDNTYVVDLSTEISLNDSHLFTVGVFNKTQHMNSESLKLFRSISEGGLGLPRDSLSFISSAGYLLHTYLINTEWELETALRLDHIDLKWHHLNQSINKNILSPRLQIKNEINKHLIQRFSYGLGYRAPLTFLESQHGNNENGYQIRITDIEKAHSFVYSISYNTPNYYLTFGSHYTLLHKLAYGEDTQGNPINYKNSDEAYGIWVNDLLAGYRLLPWWFLESSLEYFNYPDPYKAKLPTAAIESRLQINSEMTWTQWSQNIKLNLVGERDLSKYGDYRHYYNIRTFLGNGGEVSSEPKNQKAPTYFTMDLETSYQWTPSIKLTAGIYNVFDYTQTSINDSPTGWHLHFDHAHFDNLHTWGPNKGREFYIQFTAEI